MIVRTHVETSHPCGKYISVPSIV